MIKKKPRKGSWSEIENFKDLGGTLKIFTEGWGQRTWLSS